MSGCVSSQMLPELPRPVWGIIFNKLPLSDCLSVARVSKTFQSILYQNTKNGNSIVERQKQWHAWKYAPISCLKYSPLPQLDCLETYLKNGDTLKSISYSKQALLINEFALSQLFPPNSSLAWKRTREIPLPVHQNMYQLHFSNERYLYLQLTADSPMTCLLNIQTEKAYFINDLILHDDIVPFEGDGYSIFVMPDDHYLCDYCIFDHKTSKLKDSIKGNMMIRYSFLKQESHWYIVWDGDLEKDFILNENHEKFYEFPKEFTSDILTDVRYNYLNEHEVVVYNHNSNFILTPFLRNLPLEPFTKTPKVKETEFLITHHILEDRLLGFFKDAKSEKTWLALWNISRQLANGEFICNRSNALKEVPIGNPERCSKCPGTSFEERYSSENIYHIENLMAVINADLVAVLAYHAGQTNQVLIINSHTLLCERTLELPVNEERGCPRLEASPHFLSISFLNSIYSWKTQALTP